VVEMNEQEKRGYLLFEKWVLKNGMKFERCKGKGYDYIVTDREGRKRTYEVKGSKKIRAIPDMFYSEVDEKTLTLVANYLFVVGNILKEGNEIYYRIARNDFKPENFRPKKTWHVSKFQNKGMDRYDLHYVP
jgi:hypothetical protein